ncbi:hypothetical protein DL93DRAFT_2181829 [Clavulina sp. PMI_390]|nr:hypothetical protein DL93DRAFT_2181829 [Clavulina sp. PMI_390]
MRSTVSLLPPELLLLVCRHAVLTATEDSPLAMVTTLLTLTSINSFWRDLVIGYSLLWTCIHTKLPWMDIKIPSRPFPSDFARVTAFLQRSRGSPIQLFVRRAWHVKDPACELEKPMIDHDWRLMYELVAPHLDRCWSVNGYVVSLHLDHSTTLPPLFQPHRFPLLRELDFSIFCPCDEEITWGQDWLLSPVHTPLETLRFRDEVRDLPVTLDLPWPTLSTLELRVHEGFWPRICALLAQLPALRELCLNFFGRDRPRTFSAPYTHRERVKLPILQKIVTDNILIWFDIATPSLASATMTWYGPTKPLQGLGEDAYRVWLPSETNYGESPYTTKLMMLLAELPLQEIIFFKYFPRELNDFLVRAFPHVPALHFREGIRQEVVLEELLEQRALSDFLPALKVVSIHHSNEAADDLTNRFKQLEAVVRHLHEASLEVRWTVGKRVMYDSALPGLAQLPPSVS